MLAERLRWFLKYDFVQKLYERSTINSRINYENPLLPREKIWLANQLGVNHFALLLLVSGEANPAKLRLLFLFQFRQITDENEITTTTASLVRNICLVFIVGH